MPVYEAKHHNLQELAQLASHGALMVPDLQRDYVWKPLQIIRLIDTLLRGWPYGNLVLWNTGVANNAIELVPHHPFRRKISRGIMNAELDQNLLGAHLPGTISMVLDGQQRLQSLLLVFGSHDSGLYLLDKDWMSDLSEDGNHPYRGSKVNDRYLFGQLFIDLTRLCSQMKTSEGMHYLPRTIEYEKLFRWACPSVIAEHVGGGSRAEEYRWPIDKLWEKNLGEGRNRYILASELWSLAIGFNHKDDGQKSNSINQLLKEKSADNWDSDAELDKVKRGVKRLLELLSSVQQSPVGVLTIGTQQESGCDTPEEYSETVITIFTRINAAGKTLEKEEITFSWLKNRWEQLRAKNPDNIVTGIELTEKVR